MGKKTDIAGIMNAINRAIEDMGYEAVGYDNTDGDIIDVLIMKHPELTEQREKKYTNTLYGFTFFDDPEKRKKTIQAMTEELELDIEYGQELDSSTKVIKVEETDDIKKPLGTYRGSNYYIKVTSECEYRK